MGVLFIPYIFVWFLLKQGYSTKARAIGFSWAASIMAIMLFSSAGTYDSTGGTARPAVEVDPDRAAKWHAVATAKSAVPEALRDPSSAKFGNVWGVSAGVACGFVNAKNAFGAMAGQSRFIFDNGMVLFEDGQAGFARRWNATCISQPKAPAPKGAGGVAWGARPPASLSQFAPPVDGLAMYIPKETPEPFEGVSVAEADYSFERGRFYSANFYIDDAQRRDAILQTLVNKYGTPQAYDEGKYSYTWCWKAEKVTLRLNYNPTDNRTTVNITSG